MVLDWDLLRGFREAGQGQPDRPHKRGGNLSRIGLLEPGKDSCPRFSAISAQSLPSSTLEGWGAGGNLSQSPVPTAPPNRTARGWPGPPTHPHPVGPCRPGRRAHPLRPPTALRPGPGPLPLSLPLASSRSGVQGPLVGPGEPLRLGSGVLRVQVVLDKPACSELRCEQECEEVKVHVQEGDRRSFSLPAQEDRPPRS